MRAKLLVMSVLLLVSTQVGAGEVQNQNVLLLPSIQLDAMAEMNSPSMVKKAVVVDKEEYLFVTQDYGFGRELREIYLYRKMETHWSLLVFARTKCASPQIGNKDGEFEVTCGKKTILKLATL